MRHLGAELQVHLIIQVNKLVVSTVNQLDRVVTLDLVELELQKLDLMVLRLPLRLQMLDLTVHGEDGRLQHCNLVHHARLLGLIGPLVPELGRVGAVVTGGPRGLHRRVEAARRWKGLLVDRQASHRGFLHSSGLVALLVLLGGLCSRPLNGGGA